ncbi:MAG: GatB/YqeY domain-containing protein [Anaerolineae bacterium]|nr:GatB/YqeY domain-containing protein [Anaerolineae bacterium]
MHPKAQLQQDLKEAMKAHDELRKSVIRMTISVIKNAEVEKGGELTEEETAAVLVAEAKKRQDSIADYEMGGRDDLVAEEKAALVVLEEYLPSRLSREEIETEAKKAIEEVGAASLKDVGGVMKVLMPRLKGRADGKQVNQVVKELLA